MHTSTIDYTLKHIYTLIIYSFIYGSHLTFKKLTWAHIAKVKVRFSFLGDVRDKERLSAEVKVNDSGGGHVPFIAYLVELEEVPRCQVGM